jgi:hypothetical protein
MGFVIGAPQQHFFHAYVLGLPVTLQGFFGSLLFLVAATSSTFVFDFS